MSEQQINPQTVWDITDKLEKLVQDGFGPNALNSMMCTTTGKLVITSCGATTMRGLSVTHPIGRIITNALLSHYENSGDNSKAFLFLLCRLSQQIQKLVTNSSSEMRFSLCKEISQLSADVVPNVLIPHVFSKCVSTSDLSSGISVCQNIIHTILQGKLNLPSIEHFVKILSALFKDCQSLQCLYQTVQYHLDDFDLFCLESPGRPISASISLKGILIPRDFTSLCCDLSRLSALNFVLISCCVEQEVESDVTIKINQEEQLSLALAYNAKRLTVIAKHLQDANIQLLFAMGSISRASCDILRSHGVSVVSHVPEEDAQRLAKFSGVLPVHDVDDLLDDHFLSNVASCAKCITVILQQRKAILLAEFSAKHQSQWLPSPGQVIVSGPTNGVSFHLKSCVRSCLKAIASSFDPDRVFACSEQANENSNPLSDSIPAGSHEQSRSYETDKMHTFKKDTMFTLPGGGAFEIEVYKALDKYMTQSGQNAKLFCCVLRDAMLAVPLKLIRNSYASSAHQLNLAEIKTAIHDKHQQLIGVDAKRGNRMKVFCKNQVGVNGLDLGGCGDRNSKLTTASLEEHVRLNSINSGSKKVLTQMSCVREIEFEVVPSSYNKIMEPIASKILMIYNVLDLLTQLLRLSGVVSVRCLPACVDNDSDSDED